MAGPGRKGPGVGPVTGPPGGGWSALGIFFRGGHDVDIIDVADFFGDSGGASERSLLNQFYLLINKIKKAARPDEKIEEEGIWAQLWRGWPKEF